MLPTFDKAVVLSSLRIFAPVCFLMVDINDANEDDINDSVVRSQAPNTSNIRFVVNLMPLIWKDSSNPSSSKPW